MPDLFPPSGTRAGRIEDELVARYSNPIPRYTSYPTAPHFTPGINTDIYAEWLQAVPAVEELSLYLHVPFCSELCLYCGCHTTVARTYAPIAAYVELLEHEIALVGARLGTPREVSHIHWGGGTPTILSAEDLLKISRTLRHWFAVGSNAEIAVEIDPRTLGREQVNALAAMGVNRVSLGVQDFNETVQRTVNRIQSYEQTAKVADRLRQAGITALNLDLMYGLPYQTVDSVVRSVSRALELKPDRIALFGYAHVPWMKRHQALLPENHLPDSAERLAQMHSASETICDAGYIAIGLDHFARPEDSLSSSLSKGSLHRNFQGYTTDAAQTLIGFGTSSIGKFPQGYVQNAPTTVAYRDAIVAGHLATARGIAVTAEDRLRHAIIERLMCDLAVDLAAVAAAHGRDANVFAAEIKLVDALAQDGLAVRDGYRITVPAAVRPFVRSVCAIFDQYFSPAAARHSRAI
jgi:oxygen-independent coproporphyrinogen III oxidase